MALKTHRTLIPISRERGINNINSVMVKYGEPYFMYEYYIWAWKEFSKAKNRRRKANKKARKQRKINNKNSRR